MATIRNTYYDSLADGLNINPSSHPNYDGDDFNGGWKNGANVIQIDDGDLLGGLVDYGSFTQRTKCLYFSSDGSSCAVSYDNISPAEDVIGLLLPIKISGAPAANVLLCQLWSNAAVAAQIWLQTGRIIQTKAIYTQTGLGSHALVANTDYWLAIKIRGEASNGYVEAKLYDDQFNLIETIGNQNPSYDTVGDLDAVAIGIQTGANGFAFTLGEVWVDDADYPTLPTSSTGVVSATDLEFRYSTTAGTAGDQQAGTASGSLGKYMSTTQVATSLNGLFDDVSSGENATSDVEYRCIFITNTHATATWTGVKLWVQSEVAGSPNHAIALDGVGVVAGDSVSAQADQIADEDTAPSGETFSAPTDKATGLSIGDIGPGQCQAIWVRRTAINSGAVSAAGAELRLDGGES